MNWTPVLISLQVTAIASLLLLVIGLGIALLLARTGQFAGKTLVEMLINLPLVLPPSVVGYYLLLALGSGSPLVEVFGLRIVFTRVAAVIASMVVSLPLMVQSSRAAIAQVDRTIESAARTLGSSELEILWRITLPLARRGILAGLILGAARALGEFGATLMVAGNIPGRTQTLPLAIYNAVQNRQYKTANQMVLLMTCISFICLWVVRKFENKNQADSAR